MREHLSVGALPWVFLMAGVSFGIAGTGAIFLNDKHVGKDTVAMAGGGH